MPFMISAILLAISPDTPLSISSNTIVGKLAYCDNIDFTASMIRDSSPPEATFFNSPKSEPLLAENKNCNWSFPFEKYWVDGVISTWNRAFGMPNMERISTICDVSTGTAIRLLPWILSASASRLFSSEAISFSRVSMRISRSVTETTFCSRSSRMASKPATSAT